MDPESLEPLAELEVERVARILAGPWPWSARYEQVYDELYLSIRTTNGKADAGSLMHRLLGRRGFLDDREFGDRLERRGDGLRRRLHAQQRGPP